MSDCFITGSHLLYEIEWYTEAHRSSKRVLFTFRPDARRDNFTPGYR